MTNRDKEEHQMDLVFQPTLENNNDINNLISSTIKARRKVWFVTDLHLFVRKEKNKPECHKRNNFNTVINNQSLIHPNDLVINLGDLVDGEFTDKDALKDILLLLPGIKILVRGNNDLFNKSFYEQCGFKYVVYGFVYNDIVFTHVPIVHHNKLNIHGHIHGGKTYWVPYNKHIDVFDKDRKPKTLQEIIKAQPEYSKNITVKMDKFLQESVFEESIDSYNYNVLHIDPCND